MAISHAYPLFILLFASLFVLPALAVDFHSCYTSDEYPINVKTVEFSPDPLKEGLNANITVKGDASKGIPYGLIISLRVWVAVVPLNKKEIPLCDVMACPVPPGPFVLTLPNVFTEAQKNSKLAKNGNVFLRIEKKNLMLDNMIMCLFFHCPKEGYTSMLSQVTE